LYGQFAEHYVGLRQYRGLPPPEKDEAVWAEIWREEVHHSTAIEGNTLALAEVGALISQGRAIGGKPMLDYLEVQGYANAAKWVYAQTTGLGEWQGEDLITFTEIREMHELTMRPQWDGYPHPHAGTDEGPGAFRRHNIKAFPGGMKPPDWTEVPHLLSEWVGSSGRLIGMPMDALPEALASLHANFERIHPFIDGNGRVGRLTTNLLLVRLGLPPAVIRRNQRDRYLAALSAADRGNPGPLGELLARATLDSLLRFWVPEVAGLDTLITLESLAEPGLTVAALRAAAARGRLKAYRARNNNWVSCRAWVQEYKQSRSKRGRPPLISQ